MALKKIAFIGDSFTWGEGLELYLNSSDWIEQRNKKSCWPELINIQTPESILFRETNRFANKVANYFNSELIIDKNNGGSLGSMLKLLNTIIDMPLIDRPEVVIFQFSCFIRNPLHFYLGSFDGKCQCTLCNNEKFNISHGTIHCYYHLQECIRKTYIEKIPMTEEIMVYHNFLMDELNFSIFDLNNPIDVVDSFNYLHSLIDTYSYLDMKYLLNNYIKPLEKSGTRVFFLDSWDERTSKVLHEVHDIQHNMIPLNGYNNSIFTKNWSKWEKTFPYQRIQHEFPKTQNGHPTLLQNEYLTQSIINHLNKFDFKKLRFL